MTGLPFTEQWPEERIGEDAVVKDLLEAVQRLLASSMLEQSGDRSNIDSRDASTHAFSQP